VNISKIHDFIVHVVNAIKVPGHIPRIQDPELSLFKRTRLELIARDKCCWICGTTEGLEAHHSPIEWQLTNMIDWGIGANIRQDFPTFNWASFDTSNPYAFVDNMLFNGKLLCKIHHIGKNEGIHSLLHSFWIAQRYAKEGYQFSDIEIIHHQL
jgi:hypothetical protein